MQQGRGTSCSFPLQGRSIAVLVENWCAGGSVLSQIAPAELGFENPTVFQHIFNHRAILFPGTLVFLVLRDPYETLLPNQHNNPSNIWLQREIEWGQKGGTPCRCAEELWFVCSCGISTGHPTLPTAAAFLMALEKWAVRLCNKKKPIKIHSQSLIPLG